MTQVLGVDVSENNILELNDFEAMVDAGCKYIIIRSSYGWTHEDSCFRKYCTLADQVGLSKMAYHYSYAHNESELAAEAENCAKVISDSGVSLDMVWYDCEEERLRSWATEACSSFINKVGLNCGVYASYSWFTDSIDWKSIGCPIWVAQYNNTCDLVGYMWQFTDALQVGNQQLDGDYMFVSDED